MPVVQPSFKPTIATGAKVVSVQNITVTTDYPMVLPDLTKGFSIKSLNGSILTVKDSLLGGIYTIPVNCELSCDGLELSATTLYISSNVPATTVETIIFYG